MIRLRDWLKKGRRLKRLSYWRIWNLESRKKLKRILGRLLKLRRRLKGSSNWKKS